MKKRGFTRAELAAIALTIVFAAFAAGHRLGSDRQARAADVGISAGTVSAARSPAEVGEIPQAARPPVININTASAEELQTLHGVGETIARRIIDYREANGPFERIEEITRVSGIGSATFEDIMDSITVG